MKTKEQSIESIKRIIAENQDIHLGLGETGSAKWSNEDLSKTWAFNKGKQVGYVSALSEALGITPEDLQ